MTNLPAEPRLTLSPEIDRAARAWTEPVVAAAGPALRALYVYGSALGPDFDPRSSDINLLLITRDLQFERLDGFARVLAGARPDRGGHYRFMPLFLSEAQARTSADVFPIDYLDLLERRALLLGEDVLAGVEVSLSNLRHQCEYELRSRLIGLRQSWLRAAGTAGTAHALLVRTAGGSLSLYRHLLTLRRQPHPADPAELTGAVAAAYGVAADALLAPYLERRAATQDEAVSRARFAAHLDAIEALALAVDRHRVD